MKPVTTSVLPDRDMAEDQRNAARLLKGLQRLADAAVGLVDLVEEEDVRDALVLEVLEDDLQGRDLFLVGLRDNDREIDAGDHRLRLEAELDRARTIKDGELVAHVFGFGDVYLDAHLVSPGLRRGIADGVLFRRCALSGHRSGPREDRFEERSLAAREWPHQCNAPGAGYSAAITHGRRLPMARVFSRHARPPTPRTE